MFRLVLEFYGTIGVPLIYLLGLYLIAYGTPMRLPQTLQIWGLIGAGLGILMWVISYINLGKSFGVLPREQKRVKRGIYGYIKHPMYKGIMLTYLGLAMANQSLTGAWYSVLILFPLLFIRARIEDKKLK